VEQATVTTQMGGAGEPAGEQLLPVQTDLSWISGG
jgi:hypothetical protein